MAITQSKKQKGDGRHWYAIRTYSGYEDAVVRYLKQRVESYGMKEVFDVIVPKEKKIRIKNGTRREVEEKIYPGYVLVDMILTDDSWYLVRNTPRVTGFVGADATQPAPLSGDEVDALMVRMGTDITSFSIDFAIGDMVKITDGPFKDYEAKVSEIDVARGKVKVLAPIFGRDTILELDSLQIQKL